MNELENMHQNENSKSILLNVLKEQYIEHEEGIIHQAGALLENLKRQGVIKDFTSKFSDLQDNIASFEIKQNGFFSNDLKLIFNRGKIFLEEEKTRWFTGAYINSQISILSKNEKDEVELYEGTREFTEEVENGRFSTFIAAKKVNTHEEGEKFIYCYPNGDMYEGQMKNNKKHGKGRSISKDGYAYEGEWQDDKKHGQGIYKYSNGDTYEGGWQDDKRHGQGIIIYANGIGYSGEWKNGKKHGQGIYKYSDRDTYEGEFQDGKICGQGIFTRVDKNIKTATRAEYKNNFVVKNHEITIEDIIDKTNYSFKYLPYDNIEFTTSKGEKVLIDKKFQQKNPRLMMFLDILGNASFDKQDIHKLNKFSLKNNNKKVFEYKDNNKKVFEYKEFIDSKSFLEFLNSAQLKDRKFIVDVPGHEVYIENGQIIGINAENEKKIVLSCFSDNNTKDLESFFEKNPAIFTNISLDKNLKIDNVEIPMSVLCCRHAVYALALISAQYGSIDEYLRIKELKIGISENLSTATLVRPSSPAAANCYRIKKINMERNVLEKENFQLT